MSTIRAATLANLAGTGSPDIVGGELSRARFNLNGTGTIAARDSFGISSFVDNGTGNYTANFVTAFPNSDYSPIPTARISGTITIASSVMDTVTANAITVISSTVASTPAAIDVTFMLASIFGDKP